MIALATPLTSVRLEMELPPAETEGRSNSCIGIAMSMIGFEQHCEVIPARCDDGISARSSTHARSLQYF